MFNTILSVLSNVRKVFSVIVWVVEIVGGILQAAKASGYEFPAKATA